MEKISVAVRFRPETSIASAGDRRWRIEDNRISLHGPPGSPLSGASFAFDHVFDGSTTNAAVYDLLVKSIIDSTINGFNGTTFAYGQTNSGKTYTMNGSEEDPGIIQMAVGDIFNNIEMIKDRDFMFRVSYMEIYNEEINDLLSLGGERLEIHENLERGVYVAGLREEVVNDAEQVLQLIKLGEANRRFGETNMNARSSRSHTIFRMVIESSTKESISSRNIQSVDAIRVSILNLVDLAGSERVAKTGADGVRLKEGKYINKSLMILGNVINKLSDCGKQRGHIPYRDSKLTRILQSALGGNAKTSIICTVAPEELHIEETKGTLQFASRAKRITNCAQVNEILTDAVLLKRQRIEIEELRRKLQGSNFELLEEVILKHRNDMLKSELENEKLAMELNEKKKYCQILEEQVKEQKRLIENLGSFSSDQNMSLKEGADIDGDRLIKSDCFQTPDMKITSGDFVVRRRDQSMLPDSSPIPEITETVADEDVWLQLNNGHTTDLDLLQMTPNLKPNSSLSNTLPEHPMAVERSPFSKFKCSRRVELIESSMKQLASLEEENSILKEEKASLEQTLSWSYENEKLLEREKEELRKELNLNMQKMSDLEEKASFSSLSDEKVKVLEREKEELLEELNMERQKMSDLTGQIRLFSVEFARRDKQLVSLHSKSKAMVESFRTCPVPKPAQTEC